MTNKPCLTDWVNRRLEAWHDECTLERQRRDELLRERERAEKPQRRRGAA